MRKIKIEIFNSLIEKILQIYYLIDKSGNFFKRRMVFLPYLIPLFEIMYFYNTVDCTKHFFF